MVIDINISNRKSAEKLNKEVCKVNEQLYVHADNGMIMIDARSLIGLYAVVGLPCKLVAGDNADPMILASVAKKAGVCV